jgi:hypothetical protein
MAHFPPYTQERKGAPRTHGQFQGAQGAPRSKPNNVDGASKARQVFISDLEREVTRSQSRTSDFSTSGNCEYRQTAG